jgi:uncharacterized protein YjbI with pentapeptide repeats
VTGVERETVTGLVFDGSVFADVNWERVENAEFQGCTFVGSNLNEAVVKASRFVECRFERCDLSLWKPTDSVVGGCHFEDCRMLGIDWTIASWPRVALYEANTFLRCDLSHSTFADLDLGPTRFSECRLRESSFRFARMAGADLKESDCLGTDFHGADLSGAALVGVAGLTVDPLSSKLQGATVDADGAIAILESLGINLEAVQPDPPSEP